jgi:hypothetical protein
VKGRNRPTKLGELGGVALVYFHDQAAKSREILRERCGSCAFRPGTFANRCAATVSDAIKCASEGIPFYCHEDKLHETKCAGWLMLRGKLPAELDTKDWKWAQSPFPPDEQELQGVK